MRDLDQFSQDEEPLSQHAQDACYTGLPSEAVRSLEQDAQRAQEVINKASFDLGVVLCSAREKYRYHKHGGFEAWVEKKLNMSRRTAYHVMERYETFGSVQNFAHFDIVLSAQYRLSASSVPPEAREEALARAKAGEKITLKVAKEIIEAQRAQQHAEEAEQQARTEARQAQQAIATLTQQIEALQQEMASAEQSRVEIREVEKEIIPPEVTATLETLRQRLQEVTEQKQNLSKRVKQLSEELTTRQTSREAEQALREARICQQWRELTGAFHRQVVALLGQFPSPLDAQVFAAEEWNRLHDLEELAQRLLVACSALREASQRTVIEADP